MLHTPRTIIRAWNRYDDDRCRYWPEYHDPLEVIWNLQRPQVPFSGSWLTDMIGSRRHWAVDSRSGDLMGRISLRDIDNTLKQARLGITFSASYVGRGLGTEAMKGFLDSYFTDLGFATMVLDVAAPNERAVRSYRSLSFAYVESDWRNAYNSITESVLDTPSIKHLKSHFRVEQQMIWVEFFEMRLTHDMWRQYRALHPREMD